MENSFLCLVICLVATLERACNADIGYFQNPPRGLLKRSPFILSTPPLQLRRNTQLPQTSTTSTATSPSRTQMIESFHVKSDIRFRFATTQIVSVVRNVADYAEEISFDVTLPKEAFIVGFSMEIDGKVYDGEVKEKSEAKRDYQAAVDRGESAGHVKQVPRHANIFEVSVNVANGSAVNFTLTYQEMLRRKLGVYEQEIHISPGQPVEDFLIEMYIHENNPLKFVRTPALRTESLISNRVEEENELTIVDRPSPETAYVTYAPSLVEQGNGGVSARFVVQYDVEHSSKGDVMVVDGYFIHFFAPELPSMPKDIIFVLDVSGSMFGRKIEQLKTAMLAILKDLQPEDRFNIITFSSGIKKWKTSLVDAREQTIAQATQFVDQMNADGMTNINLALLTAVEEIKLRDDKERVAMVFFLTDGDPTVGIQDTEKIAANVFKANGNASTIFGLAFGSGADYDSLKTISAQNSGFARKIYEASDAALQVASLYKEISSVAMKDISIQYLPSTVDEYTITDNEFPIIFNGSEVIICGRMAPDAEEFELEIKGKQKSGEVNLILGIDDVNNIILDPQETDNNFFTMPRDFAGIVEKMWAYLTIKQMLREKERNRNDEVKVEELKKKILEMSLKYKFVTPLTSMVVTKPETNEKAIEAGLEDVDDMTDVSEPKAYSNTGTRRSRVHKHRLAIRRKTAKTARGTFGPVPVYASQNHHFVNSYMSDPDPMLPAFQPDPMFPATWPALPGLPTFSYHRPATTTTTTTTTSPTRTNTKNPRPSGKITSSPNSARSLTLTASPLTAISASLGNRLSVCLAPRKIKNGTYLLIRSNDTSVNIDMICSRKACRTPLVKQVTMVSGGDVATVFLNDKINQSWKYTFSIAHTVTVYGPDKISVAAGGMEMIIHSFERKHKIHYRLEMKLEVGQRYRGLIGDFLNLPARKLRKLKKRKVPFTCRRINADFSKSVKNKQAARYQV